VIQTVVGIARSMLIGSGLFLKYWSNVMSYVMLIYNATLKTRFKDDGIAIQITVSDDDG
jgi:hypothetical protein